MISNSSDMNWHVKKRHVKGLIKKRKYGREDTDTFLKKKSKCWLSTEKNIGKV